MWPAPSDYFKPVFDSLCGLWFLPLPHVGLPTSLQRLIYQYVSTLTDSLSMCPKTSFGFIMGTCRTYSVFVIDMAPCSCSSGDSCRAGTLFFMPGQESLVPPPSPRPPLVFSTSELGLRRSCREVTYCPVLCLVRPLASMLIQKSANVGLEEQRARASRRHHPTYAGVLSLSCVCKVFSYDIVYTSSHGFLETDFTFNTSEKI